MRFLLLNLALLASLSIDDTALAQAVLQPTQQPAPSSTQPSTPQPTPHSAELPNLEGPLKVVLLNIVMVEAPASKLPDDQSPDDLLLLVDRLARENELTGHTRLQLSTADGQAGFVQNGEQANIPTAVDPRVGRVTVRNYTRQAIGTTVRCTPRIVEGGIVASLEIEDSRLVPSPRPMVAPDEPVIEPPPTLQTSMARSIVTIPTGKAIILGGQQSTTPDGKSRKSLIIVSAKVQ